MGIFSKLTTFYLSNRIKSINNNKGNAIKDQTKTNKKIFGPFAAYEKITG